MKIIAILKNFTEKELQSFHLFLQSPFFEIPEEVVHLYKIITIPLRQGQEDQLQQRFIYEVYCSKGKQITLAQFNKIAWKLHQVIEQFHSHHVLKKNQWLQKNNLLQSYHETASPEVYTALHGRTLKQLKSMPERSEDYYLNHFQLRNDLYFYHATNKKSTAASALLSQAQMDLDNFYILSKLRLGIELLSRQQFLKEEHDIRLLDEVSVLAKKEKGSVFSIYRQLITLISINHPPAIFKKLKDDFEKNLNLFSKKEQATILQFLLNYTNRLFNLGQAKYLIFQFELYQLAVRKKLLLENQQLMSDLSFTNLIITACLCKEFDYAYYFLQTNKKYLHPDTRQNAVNLSWAYIHFHNKQFDKSWKQILKTDFITTDYKLRARSLLLRCYYEQLSQGDQIERSLKHNLQSFKKFIYRLSSVSDRVKNRYYNQINAISALFRFDPAIDEKKAFKQKWTQFIENHPIIAKKWLLEKVKQL